MKTVSAIRHFAWKLFPLIAVVLTTVVALVPTRAGAAVAQQLEPFYDNAGTLVVSDNGEPDDAVLIRSFDTQRNGIMWQLMTQHVTPGGWYDVWLEGSNDGSRASAFRWWVGRVRATPQGEINATGKLYVDEPLGAYWGWFSNPRAAASLIIRTTNGALVQTAFFAAL